MSIFEEEGNYIAAYEYYKLTNNQAKLEELETAYPFKLDNQADSIKQFIAELSHSYYQQNYQRYKLAVIEEAISYFVTGWSPYLNGADCYQILKWSGNLPIKTDHRVKFLLNYILTEPTMIINILSSRYTIRYHLEALHQLLDVFMNISTLSLAQRDQILYKHIINVQDNFELWPVRSWVMYLYRSTKLEEEQYWLIKYYVTVSCVLTPYEQFALDESEVLQNLLELIGLTSFSKIQSDGIKYCLALMVFNNKSDYWDNERVAQIFYETYLAGFIWNNKGFEIPTPFNEAGINLAQTVFDQKTTICSDIEVIEILRKISTTEALKLLEKFYLAKRGPSYQTLIIANNTKLQITVTVKLNFQTT